MSTIRYLSLGGPSTWGVGLENPEPMPNGSGGLDVHEAAYPYRLSPDVHNAAQRIGGPTLSSLCAQSIVDDQIYDVISIEFSHFYLSKDFPALALLAQRLRQRFPKALLVFVQLWSPSQYHDSNSGMNFADWRAQMLQNTVDGDVTEVAWDSETWQDHVSDYDWVLSSEAQEATKLLQEIVDEYSGQLVHLGAPSDAEHGLRTANKWFLELATFDEKDELNSQSSTPLEIQYTLSSRGHMVVSSHLQSIVDQEKILFKAPETRNEVGDWGSGDQCQLWYDTGTKIVQFSSNLELQEFVPGKFALEIPSDGGTIVVHNPFSEERMLYLTYMTASAGGHSRKIYPKVQVQVISANGQDVSPGGVYLDPYHDNNSDDRHITRTTAIGKIPATTRCQIQIQPIQETASGFRLVGASFLAKEKAQLGVTSHAEFDLEPQRVHVRLLEKHLDFW